MARLRIAAPLTQLVFPHELSFGWLFPTPDEDALYRELIRVPFYVPFGNTNNPIEVNPLLLIPYYFGSFVERSSRKNASDNVVAMLKHLLVT